MTFKPGDRVLIAATVGVRHFGGTEMHFGSRVVAFDIDGLDVLPDERPQDPDWWPPQPGDVAINTAEDLILERSDDGYWRNVTDDFIRHDDNMRGADLIARDGKRWPEPREYVYDDEDGFQ